MSRRTTSAEATGFSRSAADVTLLTEQNLNLTFALKVGAISETVTVTTDANDLDRALTTVQTKLERKPNDSTLLYLEADVLTKKGAEPGTPEFQLAMRSAKKAVSLRPTLGPTRAVLAKLYLQAGQYTEAAEQCRKALDIDPKDQTSLYRLIQALRKTGNNAEIPGMLKRLAWLRQEATKEEREHYRYKLVEGGDLPAQPAQP